jgi:phosphoribosylanthranilate isomerase
MAARRAASIPRRSSSSRPNVPAAVRKVGLLVDDSDARIADILGACDLDLLQLHGHETPDAWRRSAPASASR